MHRRTFTRILAAPALAAAEQRVDVALITHAGAAHVSAYVDALAQTDDVGRVYLSCPDAGIETAARKALGAKLAGWFRSPRELFLRAKPRLALITMEAAIAPPAIS